jgi:DNA-binding transcriptional regulator YiaG
MTNTRETGEQVLKTDVLGRVKTPKEGREVLLDEFEKSGLTGQKFAAVVGIKYQTFATWAQKRRRQRGSYPTAKVLVKTPKQCHPS